MTGYVIAGAALVLVFLVGAWVVLGKLDKSINFGLLWVFQRAGFGDRSEKAARIAGLALLAVLLAFVFWPKDKAAKAEAAPAEVQAETVKQAAQETESCACSAGGVCTGRNGGKYCVTEAGGKKYLPR
jgi:hypothetical protein